MVRIDMMGIERQSGGYTDRLDSYSYHDQSYVDSYYEPQVSGEIIRQLLWPTCVR